MAKFYDYAPFSGHFGQARDYLGGNFENYFLF
jgi:hypothetical protein